MLNVFEKITRGSISHWEVWLNVFLFLQKRWPSFDQPVAKKPVAKKRGVTDRIAASMRFALVLCLLSAILGCQVFNSSRNVNVAAGLAESNALAGEMNQKGILCVKKNQLSKAESLFEKATQANPTFGPAYNNLGLVYFHQHDFSEAARAFEAASEYLPNNPEPLNNLGLVMETVARPDDAIDLYWQAHELAPTNAEYLGNLLRARVRLGQIDDEVLSQLHSLLLFEKRPEWQDWAREQLGLLNNPNLDRGPPKPSSEPLSGLTGGKSLESTESTTIRSNPSTMDTRPNPPSPMVSPENNLRLPPVIPEELPNIEIIREFPGIPSIPSTRVPRKAPPASLPTSLPRPVRLPSSILEPLE